MNEITEQRLHSQPSSFNKNHSSTYYVGLYTWLRYSHKFQFNTVYCLMLYNTSLNSGRLIG